MQSCQPLTLKRQCDHICDHTMLKTCSNGPDVLDHSKMEDYSDLENICGPYVVVDIINLFY